MSNRSNHPTGGGDREFDSIGTENLSGTVHFPDPADDMPGIQAAVDAADPGDTIYLREGTYEPTKLNSEGDNLLIDKSLRVTGSGEGSLIRTPDNFSSTDGVKLVRSSSSASWIQFDHFKIDGNRQNNATNATNDGHNLKPQGGNVMVHNMVSVNSTGDGCAATGSNLLICNNRIEESYENNIHVNNGENVVIANNVLRGEEVGGSIAISPIPDSDTVDTCIVTGNTVLDANDNGIDIVCDRGVIRNCRVTNNTVVNATGFGIRAIMDDGEELNVVIEGNTIRGGATDALKLRRTSAAVPNDPEFIVRNNSVYDNDGSGIFADLVAPASVLLIEDNLTLDNNANASSSRGIKVDGGSAAHGVVSITGNKSYSVDNTQAWGIIVNDIGSASHSRLARNEALGNTNPITFTGTAPDYIEDNTPALSIDVRNLKAETGNEGFHDGSGTNTSGPAYYSGSDWVSLVDGSVIA